MNCPLCQRDLAAKVDDRTSHCCRDGRIGFAPPAVAYARHCLCCGRNSGRRWCGQKPKDPPAACMWCGSDRVEWVREEES